MHRKKALHMVFRKSSRVRRLFYRVSFILDWIKAGERKEALK